MLRTLKELFDSFSAPAADPAGQEHALRLATAVLLVEVMRAEPEIQEAERNTVMAALRRKFALADDEVDQLLEAAEEEGRNTYDYHRFTSSINDHFSQPQKIAMVEAMWDVAYANSHIDAHENHLISKIAGLLHVTHGEYIGAKMRAREKAGVAPPPLPGT